MPHCFLWLSLRVHCLFVTRRFLSLKKEGVKKLYKLRRFEAGDKSGTWREYQVRFNCDPAPRSRTHYFSISREKEENTRVPDPFLMFEKCRGAILHFERSRMRTWNKLAESAEWSRSEMGARQNKSAQGKSVSAAGGNDLRASKIELGREPSQRHRLRDGRDFRANLLGPKPDDGVVFSIQGGTRFSSGCRSLSVTFRNFIMQSFDLNVDFESKTRAPLGKFIINPLCW